MATTPMSHSMLKWTLCQVGRCLDEADHEFMRYLTARPVQPFTTFSKSWDVRIATPQDGTREFVVSVTITEDSTPANTPTTGHDISTK